MTYKITYTGNGSQRDFVVPADYIRKSHVTVKLNGVLNTAYVWFSDSTIRFDVAPANGVSIVLERKPPVDDPLNDFSNSTIITNESLNENFRQSLQITERALVAEKLDPGATINGVNFDGTAPITIRAAPSHSVYKTVYVSPEGNNGSSGRNEDRAVADIEQAVDIIEAQGDPTGWTIKLLGDINTAGEIELPKTTTVEGNNFQRRTIIRPSGTTTRNVFLADNGCQLANLKFTGWQIDDLDNPSKGFGMAFKPGAIILPGGVPYAQNCVVTAALTDVPTPLPGDAANQNPAQPVGGGCVIADGSVLSPYSVYPNIMTWGFTPASKNGIGYVAKNRAHINCVNAIGVGQHIHFMAINGGNLVLSACSSQFGDYSLWSQGTTTRVVPLKVNPSVVASVTNGRSIINTARAAILADVLPYIAGLTSWDVTQTALYTKDTNLLLDAIGVCIEFGTEIPMLNIAEGFFDFTGACVFPYSQLPNWKLSFTRIRDQILANTSLSAGVDAFITALFARLVATLDNHFYETAEGPAPSPVEPVRKPLRSLITAIGHQWTAPLAGTQFFRVPPSQVSRAIKRSIVQRDGGRIRFSGQDDQGNAVFVGGLTIDARSGQLGGPPFDTALRGRVTRAIISRSY